MYTADVMMTSDGVGVAQHQLVSAADKRHGDVTTTPRRPAKSPLVWNSRTTPLSEVLRAATTPIIVRDEVRRSGDAPRDVYVHSVTPCSVVLADRLTADARCGLVSTGSRYLIPVDHRGWFELLSQDGHAAAPITSVQQLMKLAPERCLVRRTIEALSGDNTGRWMCKISAGETLSIEGVVSSTTSHGQCLRCRLDRTGQSVLLTSDQRGLFSPVAAPNNVAGVHRMRSVVAKFRLPVIVRLIGRKNVAVESPSSNNPASAVPNVAFRAIATLTEPAANVVPLWLIGSASEVSSRSLLSLPTSAQASSALDGVASTGESRATLSSESWSDSDWHALRRRCDALVGSRAITAELTKLLPTRNVDDRHRTVPGAISAHSAQQRQRQSVAVGGDDEWRLMREIDHIYDAIKATGHQKNDARTTTTRQMPRRYRNVRQEMADVAALNSAAMMITRSPARRSNTLDGKPPPHHHSAVDHQLHNGRHVPVMSPVRLRRVVSQTTPIAIRHHSPPLLQPQLSQHSEPVYEELKSPKHLNNAAPEAAVTPDSGQYVELEDSRVTQADNLRQVIRPKATMSAAAEHSNFVDRSRRWSVAGSPWSDHNHNVVASGQLQVFDDLTNNDSVTVPAVPVIGRPNATSSANKTLSGVRANNISRSVSSGRLTSSSSDDVASTDRKSSSSALAAVTSTLKRALFRTKKDARAADSLHPSYHHAVDNPLTDHTSRRADDVAVTSHLGGHSVDRQHIDHTSRHAGDMTVTSQLSGHAVDNQFDDHTSRHADDADLSVALDYAGCKVTHF